MERQKRDSAELYRARWVVPVTSRPIPDGAVVVRRGAIEAVGRFRDVRDEYARGSVVDLGEAVMLPGLVNAHTHLQDHIFHGKTVRGSGDFLTWLDSIVGRIGSKPDSEIAGAVNVACEELVNSGTIAVGDISSTLLSYEPLARRRLYGLLFAEVAGFSRQRARDSLLQIQKLIREAEKMNVSASFAVSITPHALYSTHVDVVAELIRLNREANRITSLHLSESEFETSFLLQGDKRFEEMLRRRGYWQEDWRPPEKRPVRFLEKLGGLSENLLAVHCVELEHGEIELLAGACVSVCLCPRSNDYIGLNQPLIADMLSAGLKPCLGTDGPGSVDSLSLFDEMAFVRERHPSLAPADVLEMATVSGAKALRLFSKIGSLEPGKDGRILAYSGDPGDDPIETLTSGIDHSKLSWVGEDIEQR